MAERFMYLPSAGFALASVAVGFWAVERVGLRGQAMGAIVLAVVLACFFARTWSRNADWQDDFHIFASAAEVSSGSTLVHLGLGHQYYKLGRYDLATSCYEQALSIYPEFGQAHSGLGNIALAQENYAKAVEHLSRAVSLIPGHDESRILLGMAYWGLGRLDQAQRETEIALALNPKNSQAHNNLGNIHFLKGNLPEAMSRWEQAVVLNPYNAEALYNLALNYDRIGEDANARSHYERFLAAAPDTMAELKTQVRARLSTLESP
jgi:tetratricopeptide (TPR) repeat protein